MSRLARLAGRLAARLDDALNPIVVKELRQAVRGRFLAGILIFFLALQLATLGLFLLSKGISSVDLIGGDSYGKEVYAILAGILFFAAVFCVPIYAAARIYAERAGDQMALFFVSTLAPHRIIAGKLASNLTLSLLLFSACLPYLSFTYYLRGVDLPSIFIGLATGFLASAAAIQGVILLASLPVSRLLRVLVGLAGLVALFMLFTSSLGMAIAMAASGVGSQLATWEFWGAVLALAGGGALLCGLAFFLSVAVVTHAAANRARPVRLYMLFAWLASGAATAYACYVHSERSVVDTWLRLTITLLAFSLLPAICARDRMSVRVRGEVPRGGVRRSAAFFLFSGSANGVAFSASLMAMTLAAGKAFERELGHAALIEVDELAGFCGYAVAYALLAVLLQRGGFLPSFKRPQTWVLALVLIAFLSLAPPVAGFLIAPDRFADTLGVWTIFSPTSPFRHDFTDLAIRFGLGWAAIMCVAASRWFGDQVRDFRPPGDRGAEVVASPALTGDAEGAAG